MRHRRLALLFGTPGLVWLVLVSATALMWWLRLEGARGWGAYTSAIIIVIAFVKIRLVMMYFMQTRHAPLLLRLVLDGWVIGVAAGVLFFLAIGRGHA